MEQSGLASFVYKLPVEEAVNGNYVCYLPPGDGRCLAPTPSILKLDMLQVNSAVVKAKVREAETLVYDLRKNMTKQLAVEIQESKRILKGVCLLCQC